ncbi:TPA: DUF1542 domain-containing protein, partial [Enterococcus faecium]
MNYKFSKNIFKGLLMSSLVLGGVTADILGSDILRTEKAYAVELNGVNQSENQTGLDIQRIDGLVMGGSNLKIYIPGSEGKIVSIAIEGLDGKEWYFWRKDSEDNKLTYEGNDIYMVPWTNQDYIKYINDAGNVGKFLKFKASDDYTRWGSVFSKEIEDKKITSEKEKAKVAIDEEAKKVKSAIDADSTLTPEEKNKQKTGIDQEAEQSKTAIDGMKDIDGVNKAKEDGIKVIDDQHIGNYKVKAKTAIEAEAKKVKSSIDADGTLTPEEKNKQKAGVDQEAEKAKTAIDGASDITGINQAKEAGVKAIDGQHQSGESVDSRKAQAKAAIEAEAKKVKSEIDADGTLT